VSKRSIHCRFTATENAAEELVQRHLSLVACIARDIHGTLPLGVSLEDVIGAGNIGLLQSARRFDPTKGASFQTFARHRIRGAITDSLRRLDHVSRRLRAAQKKAERATSALTAKLGRNPSELEVARQLEMPLPEWRKLRRELHEAGCGIPDAGNATVPVDSASGTWHDPERHTEFSKLRMSLRRALSALPARHRLIIQLHDFNEVKMARISEELGVSAGRVSQIRAEALACLRAELVRLGVNRPDIACTGSHHAGGMVEPR